MTEAKFCDISNHQPSTRAYIQAIKDWGAKAVVLKVTEGNYFIDPTAQAKKSLVESLGMLCQLHSLVSADLFFGRLPASTSFTITVLFLSYPKALQRSLKNFASALASATVVKCEK